MCRNFTRLITSLFAVFASFSSFTAPAPTANVATAPSHANPGGTTSVSITGYFGGAASGSNIIASLKILSFPTNATTITVGSSSYTSTTFPAAGLSITTDAEGVPTQLVSVNPVDGTVTVAVAYNVYDNAPKVSTTPGAVNLPFVTSTACSAGSYAGNQLLDGLTFLSGTGSTSNLVTGDYLLASGAFSYQGNNYDVVFKITATSVPNAPTGKVSLTSTGSIQLENVAPIDDPYVKYSLIIVTAGSATAANPNGTPVTIPLVWITMNDLDGLGFGAVPSASIGDVGGYISSLNPSQFVLGSEISNAGFTNGGGPTGYNLFRPTDIPGTNITDPADTTHSFQIFTNSYQSSSFVFGTTGARTTTATRSQAMFIRSEGACTSLSGFVWNDINGSAVKNTGEIFTNAGGIYANLVNATTGLVEASVLVDAATGAYTLSTNPSTAYKIIISSTVQTVGSTLTTSSLPALASGNWVNTGTNLNSTANATNQTGIISIKSAASGSIINQNFGIEQAPIAANSSLPIQQNTGTSIIIPATNFSGTDNGGTVVSIVITAFPSNAQSVSINGVTYSSASAFNTAFPNGATIATNANGNPLQAITVTPIAGNLTSILLYYSTLDNATQKSSPAIVTVPFNIPMPITGLDFHAITTPSCMVSLTWSTLTETNTNYFDIEYSVDTKNWQSIGKVAAQGNSNSVQAYSFLYKTPAYGIGSYRLKENDKDAYIFYSDIKTAMVSCNSQKAITVYPNPVKDNLTVTGASSGNQLFLYDATGKLLKSQTANGSGFDNIPTSIITSGQYFLKVVGNDGSSTVIKIIKQ